MGRNKTCHAIDSAQHKFCEQETLRLMPLIERVARGTKLPDPPFQIEDLIQEGAKACFQHLPHFDPDRHKGVDGQPIKLETFIVPRIRGAMLDYARQHGRLTSGGARTGRKERIFSFADVVEKKQTNRPLTIADVLPDEKAEVPGLSAVTRSVWKTVLRGLNQRERILVLEYFVHGRTLKSISVDLGLSESRCSQMLTGILANLRAIDAETNGSIRENLAA